MRGPSSRAARWIYWTAPIVSVVWVILLARSYGVPLVLTLPPMLFTGLADVMRDYHDDGV